MALDKRKEYNERINNRRNIGITKAIRNLNIRYNYIIDKKHVLRINSVKVMTEERLKGLNTLIKRYNDFGLKAPYFLPMENGSYLTRGLLLYANLQKNSKIMI